MRLTRLSTRGKPLRVPVRSTSIDFRLLLRDPPSRGASAPIELCFVSARAFRRRATKAKDTSGRRSAILHFKNEHPLFRAVTESLTGVAPGAPAWTGWFTPPVCPLRSALPALRRAFSSRRKWSPDTSDVPSPPGRLPAIRKLRSCDRGCVTGTYREVCQRRATQNVFLWQGALLEPFAGSPFGQCPAWVQRSTSLHPAEAANPRELGPVRSPQPQPRLASRARRHSPDSATCQRETRAHQRRTVPHTNRMLSLDSFARPDLRPSEL